MTKNTSLILLSVFLVWPLISQAVPYVGVVFFLLAGIVLLININYWSVDAFVTFSKTPLGGLLIWMNITFFYGLFLYLPAATFPVVKDLVRGFAFLCAWLAIAQFRLKWGSDSLLVIVKYFSKIILFVSLGIAVLGLIKYIFSLYGYRFNFLVSDQNLYPWGTSLVGDYNFYSLTLIIGALVVLGLWIESTSSIYAVIYGFIFFLICYSAWLAGSRRFWIISPLLFITYFYCAYSIRNKLGGRLRWKELFLGLAMIFSFVQICSYLSPPVCVDAANKVECIAHASQIGARGEHLIVHYGGRAISPRIDRWKHAFEIGGIRERLLGAGFGYRRDFGCWSSECKVDDYPHAPILSGLLYGGVIAALVTAALFFYALITAYQILKTKFVFANLAFGLIATTAYASVSGDTLFSLPIFFSMLIVSRLALHAEPLH